MTQYKVKVLNNAAKVTMLMLLISYCLPLIGFSQTKNVNILIQKLKDKDPGVRENAAKTLGWIKDPRAVDPLITALRDEDWMVRWNSVEALAKMEDARAILPLIEILDETVFYCEVAAWDLGEKAAESLSKFGTTAVEPLIEALKDDDQVVRMNAAFALGEIGDARAVEPLSVLMTDRYKGKHLGNHVYGNVVEALGKIGKPSLKYLIAALNHDNLLIRSYAAEALGVIKDPSAVEALVETLKDDYTGARESAALSLGKIKDSSAVEPLIEALKDLNVRSEAAFALGEIGDARAVEPLIVVLKDTTHYARDREKAVEALQKIKDPRSIEPLIDALNDESSDVRLKVVQALEWINEDRLVKAYISALRDEELSVVWIAYEKLVKIGQPAVESLLLALNSENRNTRRFSAYVLMQINDPRAIESFILALKDKNIEIIAGAYLFYIRRGESGTEDILIEALNKYGHTKMAQDFMNCGNVLLENAASNWAKKKGYFIYTTTSSTSGHTWGSSKK